MRAGWNSELEKRVRRADVAARPMILAEVVEAEDVVDTFDDWTNRPDSTSGFEALEDGGLRLFGAAETHIDHGGDAGTDVGDSTIPLVSRLGPIHVVEIGWGLVGMQEVELHALVARLDRVVGGGGANATSWKAQLFRVAAIEGENYDVLLQPISAPVEATASGSTPGDVTFPLSALQGGPVKVGAPASGELSPITVVMIEALTSTGAPATDAGWQANPVASEDLGDHVVSGFVYTRPSTNAGSTSGDAWFRAAVPAATPGTGTGRIELLGRAFTEEVLEITNNPLDLDAAPVGTVEFVVQGETPSDCTITVEMDDGSAGYTVVVDGDTAVGVGLAEQQTYDVRITLTPSTDGFTTPIIRRVGVRDLTTVDLSDVATVEDVQWAVDPPTLKGEIPECKIRVIRDGERDYRSAIEQLLSEHFTGQIEIKLFIGHADLARQYWLHIDTFLIDDMEYASGSVILTCVSSLQYVRAIVPSYDPIAETRTPVEYANQTLKDVRADILDGLLGIQARYIGQGPEDDTTTVSKTITEARGKEELDAIAFLAGGAEISSQGRIKFVDMAATGRGGPVATFPREEIHALSITPGLRSRVEEFFVPFAWSEADQTYEGEVRSFHADSIVKLARTYVDEQPPVLEDRIARWIADETLAETVAERQTDRLGGGLILWSFRSQYPYPELEPGDIVAVETDRFLAADPTTPTIRVIRGPVWALGVVQRVGDIWGRDFSVWIQAYSSVVPSLQTITREGYGPVAIIPILDEDGGVWFLVVQRMGGAASVIWTVTTDGTEPADPLGSDEPGGPVGTVSTADSFTVATTVVDQTRVRVKVKAARADDGTGTKGSIHYLGGTYETGNSLPRVSWRPFKSADETMEGTRFTVTDDSDEVAFWYQVFNEGGSPAAWSAASHRHTNNDGTPDPTGYASDPLVVDVEEAKPDEGGTRRVIYFRGEDGDENFSEERKLIVDGDRLPSGTVAVAVDRETGVVRVTVDSTDNDSASWRFRYRLETVGDDTFDAIAFDDGDPEEFAGDTFGVPVEVTGVALVRGQQLNIEALFFGTTSTVDTDQQTSVRSPVVRAQAVQGVETANSIRIIGHEFIPVVQGGVAGWNLVITLLKGDLCQSVHLEVSWVRANGTALQPPPSTTLSYEFDTDLSLRETRILLDEDGTGAVPLLFVRGPEFPDDDTADASVSVIATPYDDTGGEGGTGTAGEEHGRKTEAPSETGSGVRVDDSDGLHYVTDTLLLSADFAVALSGGRPEVSVVAVAEAAVTDHEAALSINFNQMTGTNTWAQTAAGITAQGVFNAGSVGAGSWTPNFANGPHQRVTFTTDTAIAKPTNMPAGHMLVVRIAAGGNDVDFAGADFLGNALSYPAATDVSAIITNDDLTKYSAWTFGA